MTDARLTADTARFGCRSWLFVPADNDRALAKAQQRDAHVLILDLEDAVAPSEKLRARAGLADRIAMLRQTGRSRVVVRVNHEAALLDDDLAAVVKAGVDAVMIPKTESAADCAAVTRLLAKAGAPTLGIVALIESPRAVIAAADIAVTENVIGIALGSEDFAAAMATAPTPAILTLPCQTLALVAAAAGVAALGLPISLAGFTDLAAYAQGAQDARAMALTGVMCIHPTQVAAVNAAFLPSPAELGWARGVVEAFVLASKQDRAVATFQGTMIDKPVLDRARRLLTGIADQGSESTS